MAGCTGDTRNSCPDNAMEEEGQLCTEQCPLGKMGIQRLSAPFCEQCYKARKPAPMHPVLKNERTKENLYPYPLVCQSVCSGVWATWVQQQHSVVQPTWNSFGRCRCESPCIYLFGTPCVKPTNGTHCIGGLYFGLIGATQIRIHTKENHNTVKVISMSLELVMASQAV